MVLFFSFHHSSEQQPPAFLFLKLFQNLTHSKVQVTQVEHSEKSDIAKVPKSVKVRALNFKIKYLGGLEYFMCSYCLMNFDSHSKMFEHLETCEHVK